jgi:hypothetical protein
MTQRVVDTLSQLLRLLQGAVTRDSKPQLKWNATTVGDLKLALQYA